MFKILKFTLLIVLLTIIFFSPLRNYLNSLFHKGKGVVAEEQIIGTVSGYNPRVKEVQEALKRCGYDPGHIDGLMGSQTRNAIREFQKKKGFKPTGKIDSLTQLALEREKERIESLPKISLAEGLNFVLDKPKTLKVEQHTKEIKGSFTQDEVINYRMDSKQRVKEIQTALKKAGFYAGKIDGRVGPQTRQAIRAFQKSKRTKA